MKDYVQLYIEFLLMIDPKLYLSEIRDYLERDLGLNGPDLPSIMTIQRFSAQRGFTRKKCTRVAKERFWPENILRRKAFMEWRKTVDPRQLFFVDETGFEDFARHYGRSPSNYPRVDKSTVWRWYYVCPKRWLKRPNPVNVCP